MGTEGAAIGFPKSSKFLKLNIIQPINRRSSPLILSSIVKAVRLRYLDIIDLILMLQCTQTETGICRI